MSTRLVCDECQRICKKTPVGMCVILCNENKILCMDCNRIRLDYQELLFKHKNIIHYLKIRSLK